MTKTYTIKPTDIERKWHLIDASDQILGRLSTRIAKLLMGKHKPKFARNADVGDYVVVINAARIKVSGDKMRQKTYYRHSGYPGGLKSVTLGKLMEEKPERVIEKAVRGMLPRNKLSPAMMKRLRVYADDRHPHSGQMANDEAGTADKD